MSHAAVVLRIFFFFFNDTATTEIYTLSLHDALPILIFDCPERVRASIGSNATLYPRSEEHTSELQSRGLISYAVFCLKKKIGKRHEEIVERADVVLRRGRDVVRS